MKWILCTGCGEEFRVISDAGSAVEFCPFCGNDIEDLEEDDDLNSEDVDFDDDYEY